MSRKLLGGIASVLLPMTAYAGGYVRSSQYQRSYLQVPAASSLLGMRSLPLPKTPARSDKVSGLESDALDLTQGQPIRELVIIDEAVPDKSVLLRGLKPGVDAVEIRSDQDGLAQLMAALSSYSSLNAVHVVSHAQSGTILLGNSRVDIALLKQEVGVFNAVNAAIKPDGDLLFYGCNLAAGDLGEALLELFAAQAHADVAASNNLTGNAEQSGDWELEIAKGNIESQQPFTDKALLDFSGILAFTGTIDFDTAQVAGSYANSGGNRGDGSVNGVAGNAGGYFLTVDGATFNSAVQFGYGTSSEDETSVTLSFTNGESFTAGSIGIWNLAGTPDTFEITANSGGTASATISSGQYASINLSSLTTGATSLTITTQDGQSWVYLDNFAVSNVVAAPVADSDGNLTSGSTVSEPIGLDTTIDSVGEALNVFDFTLTDTGSSDGLAMTVSQVVLNVSGTSTDTQRANITWRLNGNDVSNVTGTYNSSADTITFSGLGISIADGANETYAVNAYFNDNTGINEDATVILSVDGDTDLTVGGAGTQMAATSAVSNGTGTTLDVVATQLVFITQPAGSVSGSALTTQPVVSARDAFGNTDVDFTETVTLTEASAGALSGTAVAAVSGVGVFTSLIYSATADQQSFTLTANDQDGVGTNLSPVNANAVTSDVVATKLIFSTQPAPLSVNSGEATALSSAPVISAVDANDIVDTGYSTGITLAEVNGAGTATLTTTGDTDGSAATVTLTPTSGVATFSSAQITYTASGSTSENFNLQASSGGLSTANSSQMTGAVDSTPPTVSSVSVPANATYITGQNLDFTVNTNENVTVNTGGGTPQVSVTVGATTRQATYLSGSGSSALLFRYTIQAGDSDSDGIAVGTLSANGGTLQDAASNNLTLTLNSVGSTTSVLVDAAAPTVSSVSVPANATYTTGQNLDFTVNTNENVTVNTGGGTPQLSLTVGATTRQATYLSGSGSSALLFRYTIQAGDSDTDGIAVGTLLANGGTLRDAATNNLTLTLNSVGSTASVLVDAAAPTVSSVSVPANATYTASQNLDFTVNTSENVTVNTAGGTPQLSLTVGATNRQATYVSGSGSSALLFRYTIQTGESDTDGIAVGTLSANGGTLRDAATNNLTLTLNSVGSTASVLVDATAPTVSSVSVPANATYVAGQNLDFIINTSENITVNTGGGTPQVSVTVGATTRQATYLSGSGSSALLFRYTIQAGDSDTDGIAIGTLSANGGTLKDATSNDMTLTLNSVGSTASVLVNDAPTGTADNATTNEDNAVAINVLGNDSDSDSSLNPASVTITSAPGHGSTRINTGTGVITFTPDANYNGSDSFTYTVDDVPGSTSANTAVNVTINAVNDAPAALADVVTTAKGTAVNISVGGNDTDVDTGDSVDTATISLVTQPAHGNAVISAGQVVYTPVASFSGSDSFSYQIDDQNGATSNVATVKINVSDVNTAPTASNDSGTTDEDTAININLISNDSDADGSVVASSVAIITQPANGSVNVDVSGQATYTPDADYNGSDSFTYVVQDNGGATSNVATVSLTVNSVNDAPAAGNDTVSIQDSTPHKINVLGNDADVDGTVQSGTLQVVSAPANGNAVLNSGTITYTPGGGFSSDSLTYRVQDNLGTWSNTATVTLTTQPVNNAPLANNDSAATNEDSPVIISVLTNDADVDGTLDNTSITIGSSPTSGSLVDNNDGSLTYTPSANSYGSDSFTYSVRDNEASSSNSATVSISIRSVNDAPTISGSPLQSLLEGQPYSFTPTLGDADSTNLSVSATNLPGWLVLNSATGALTGTPQVGDAGSYSNIVLSITDGNETTALAAFSITVEGDNDNDSIADNVDTDDDNDGMSDSYEQSNGFNPLDASDAAQDRDGDRVTNLQESLDNTDPDDATDYTDVTAPVVTAPADLVIDATGLYTRVPLHQLLDLSSTTTAADLEDGLSDLVYDNVDGAGCCNNQVVGMVNSALLLPPGSNTVTYRAVDSKGNPGTATQIVNVRPLVSVNKNQVSAEGATVQFRVILNGQSPFYPLTVPYVIDSASTTNASDHNLVNGTVQFSSGQTVASVSITLTEDGVSESDETLIVRLDDRTSNAQDLANGYNAIAPDIYDINSGANSRHQITVTENNVAPDVTLRLSQNSTNTVLITNTGGIVTVTATVSDPNSGDQHTLDWSGTDTRLEETDGNNTDANLVFDPSELASGVYKVRVTATDDDGAEDTASLYFKLVNSLPVLGAEDTDGDGTDDATEGTADSDDDGIPDYLDNISAANVLPERAEETSAFLMECDPDIRCRVGQFALQGEGGGASVLQSELTAQGIETDTDYAYGGGIFDFELHDLPSLGLSVKIVLPQTSAIPENAVYRKLLNGRWLDFVDDANNEIHSAAGNLGYCPPPGDDSWQPGLTAGDYCVQLTIEDGGPNDADGLANGSIEDPGGVAAQTTSSDNGGVPTFPTITSKGKGSGGSMGGGMLLIFGATLLLRRRVRCVRHFALALMASAGATLLPVQHAEAFEWDEAKQQLQENGYATLALYRAKGRQGETDFQQGMAANGVNVTLSTYDITRTAYQFALGYGYHRYLALELGYLDLGDVRVDMSATGTPANLKAGLDQHYPISSEGFTLSNRFLWPLQEQTTLSAEVGLYRWDGKIDISGAPVEPDLDGGTDFLLGVAAQYNVTDQFAISAHLKRIFFDDQDVDLIGVEGKIRF